MALNIIRRDTDDVDSALRIINQQVDTDYDPTNPDNSHITLTPTNDRVHFINSACLNKLSSPMFSYHAEISGSFETFKENNYPADKVLQLKKGAKIIFTKNKKGAWVNGTRGIVHDLGKDWIKVSIGSTIVSVDREIWEDIEYAWDTVIYLHTSLYMVR